MLVGVSAAPALLAHQGGWDEILMVLGPILVFWLILRAARRRAEAANEIPGEGDAPVEGATADVDG